MAKKFVMGSAAKKASATFVKKLRGTKTRKPSKASVRRAAKLRSMVLNPASIWS